MIKDAKRTPRKTPWRAKGRSKVGVVRFVILRRSEKGRKGKNVPRKGLKTGRRNLKVAGPHLCVKGCNGVCPVIRAPGNKMIINTGMNERRKFVKTYL